MKEHDIRFEALIPLSQNSYAAISGLSCPIRGSRNHQKHKTGVEGEKWALVGGFHLRLL